MVEQGLCPTREKAKRLIMAGQAFLVAKGGREPLGKPGRQLPLDAVLELAQEERFVSRGGYKLLTAIEHFKIEVEGLVALDAGASTGGFTDCLLQFGARRVYALDVGRGQLHEKLLRDPRVTAMDRVNIRLAGPDLLPEPVDLVVVDVSFISLCAVLPACVRYLKSPGGLVALIKPQFEVGPGQTKKGVVRDPGLIQGAVDKVVQFASETLGLECVGTVPAMIKGPKGNQEHLAYFRR